MIDDITFARARRMFFAEQLPISTIATQLSVHHDAVRRAIRTEAFNQRKPALLRPLALDQFKPFVIEQLGQPPRLRATRPHDMIRQRGYEELRQYLEDGFALAKRQGNQGRGIGFVMAIFQKIAASSFAAVRRTLRRRLLMLTLHEAVLKDRDLDLDGREALYEEARHLIREEFGYGDDAVGRGQVDRTLADLKLRIVRTLDDEALSELADSYAAEAAAAQAEDIAIAAVQAALPEERQRIGAVLALTPSGVETKAEKLLAALGVLWRQNPAEKIVIFATYLGTVELLGREIENAFPGQGVVVLRGGDHGAKVAAEKRFKMLDGPKVLVCTAAGREGLNMQHARVLFNFDLPWNPMDVEQRIGRIHRYGQKHTAQVYNLVLSDTIEGKIFLLLEDKLTEIARAVGKVDEHGNVAEDLRSQILGQLSERLSYDRLYQEALHDPELRRTRLELEAALQNASEARRVVFELFQDLEGFNLDQYKPLADVASGLERLVRFVRAGAVERGHSLLPAGDAIYELRSAQGALMERFTTDRDLAQQRPELQLLGLDHPHVEEALRAARALAPEERGASLAAGDLPPGVLTLWLVETHGKKGERRMLVQPLAVRPDGARQVPVERRVDDVFQQAAGTPAMDFGARRSLLNDSIEPMLRRELAHRTLIDESSGFVADLLAWLELSGP